MSHHWEESDVNITHVGMQSLKQGDTYEKSKNILWTNEEKNKALGKIGSDANDDEIKEEVKNNRDGNHEKQIDGAAEVFQLLNQGPVSDERIAYEKIREKSLKTMRENKTYQFCMLLAGFNNVSISKYWITPSEAEMRPPKQTQCAADTAQNTSNADAQFHSWYVKTVWADGMIHLSPEIYAHLDEAYTMVTGKWRHLQGVGLEHFIETNQIRTYFARLVSWNMRTSDCLAGKRYHLERTYARVNHEKSKILNIFRHVRWREDKLIFERQELRGVYVPSTSVAASAAQPPVQTDLRAYINECTAVADGLNRYYNTV